MQAGGFRLVENVLSHVEVYLLLSTKLSFWSYKLVNQLTVYEQSSSEFHDEVGEMNQHTFSALTYYSPVSLIKNAAAGHPAVAALRR